MNTTALQQDGAIQSLRKLGFGGTLKHWFQVLQVGNQEWSTYIVCFVEKSLKLYKVMLFGIHTLHC